MRISIGNIGDDLLAGDGSEPIEMLDTVRKELDVPAACSPEDDDPNSGIDFRST